MRNKVVILSILSIFLVGCFDSDKEKHKLFSPSGKYYFITSVIDADVMLSVFKKDETLIKVINTGAGNFNQWAIGWSVKSDIIIMNSSDIGIQAWRIDNNQLHLIDLTESLKEEAERIKKQKYK